MMARTARVYARRMLIAGIGLAVAYWLIANRARYRSHSVEAAAARRSGRRPACSLGPTYPSGLSLVSWLSRCEPWKTSLAGRPCAEGSRYASPFRSTSASTSAKVCRSPSPRGERRLFEQRVSRRSACRCAQRQLSGRSRSLPLVRCPRACRVEDAPAASSSADSRPVAVASCMPAPWLP
jgi:hypothetical protein